MSLAEGVLEQARRFFSLPLEEKMKVCTDLMPDEFCGYHPMEHYNINGLKHKGTSVLETSPHMKADF